MSGRTPGTRALAALVRTPFAILPEWASALGDVALRFGMETEGAEPDAVRGELRAALATLGEGKPVAAVGDTGTLLPDAVNATVRDGIATIPVRGPLFHYASELDQPCGCTSYEAIARDVRAVMAMAAAGDVRSAIALIDSPGGQVDGVAETADLFHALRAQIPVTAYIAATGASAAYILAAAAGGSSDIVIARQAIAGSIGVRMTTGRRRNDGTAEIVSSQSPKKVLDASTAEGRAELQSMVDELATVMGEDIARYRGISLDQVWSDYGQGGVMVGRTAVKAGLANRVGDFESVFSQMARAPRATPAAGGNTHSTESSMSQETQPAGGATQPPAAAAPAAITTVDQLAAAHPALVAELRTTAATAERTRVVAIMGLAKGGDGKPVASRFAVALDEAAKPEGTTGTTAAAILAAQDAALGADAGRAKDHLAGLAEAEQKLDKPDASGAGQGEGKPALTAFLGHLPQGMVRQPSKN
jgi:ClpP class serine protease